MIHAGELLPDGRPRFRIVLVLVSRQNGKTEVPVLLAPFWMCIDGWPLTVGTSTKLEYAKETWDKTRKLLPRMDGFEEEFDSKRWYVRGAMDTSMWTRNEEARYKIAAANEEGGRSLTINRGVADELRQHRDYRAWSAMEPAASPEDAQIWCLSNAGDEGSVVRRISPIRTSSGGRERRSPPPLPLVVVSQPLRPSWCVTFTMWV